MKRKMVYICSNSHVGVSCRSLNMDMIEVKLDRLTRLGQGLTEEYLSQKFFIVYRNDQARGTFEKLKHLKT